MEKYELPVMNIIFLEGNDVIWTSQEETGEDAQED